MKRSRKHFSAQEKMALLRRHLIEKVPISNICEQNKLQPPVVYRWLKQLFENGALALERPNGTTPASPDLATRRRITELEDKLRRKEHVLSELMEEHVALKKSRGER